MVTALLRAASRQPTAWKMASRRAATALVVSQGLKSGRGIEELKC